MRGLVEGDDTNDVVRSHNYFMLGWAHVADEGVSFSFVRPLINICSWPGKVEGGYPGPGSSSISVSLDFGDGRAFPLQPLCVLQHTLVFLFAHLFALPEHDIPYLVLSHALRASVVHRGHKKCELLIEVATWNGDGLRTACLTMPTN